MSRPTVCFAHGDALDLFRGENGPRFGGSETQVYQMAKVLARRGDFDVRVVADKPVEGASYSGITFDWAVPAIRNGVPYLSRLINRARARRPYRRMRDAVVVQTILCKHTLPTWQIARELGHKFVYRMSCDADIDGSLHQPELASKLLAVIKDADGVIAQNEIQQQRLRAELRVESTIVRSIVDIPNEGPAIGGGYVLWAGRGAPIKRPWIIIETARRLPDIQFVMLMPVEDRLFWRCVAQEAEHTPNLTIIPGVSYFEMNEYYRKAAVFANTSAIEGVPSVFVQSAAQGTPVISLEVDPGGMLETGGFGYCARGDVDRFRETVSTYMDHPDLVATHGQVAFDYAVRHHSPEAVGPALAQFLHEVHAK